MGSTISHSLPVDVEWKDMCAFDNVIIVSQFKLSRQQKNFLKTQYYNIENEFFNRFERGIRPRKEKLEIRIVTTKTIKNKRFFTAASNYDFGRFFGNSNTLYITSDVFIRPDFLAHELAHYYYNGRFLFENDREEHMYVYKFQNMYRSCCVER